MNALAQGTVAFKHILGCQKVFVLGRRKFLLRKYIGMKKELSELPNSQQSNEVESAIVLIVNGNSEAETIRQLCDEFVIEESVAAQVCALAASKVTDAGTVPAEFIHGFSVLALMEIHRQSLAAGEFAESIKAVKLLHDLAGK